MRKDRKLFLIGMSFLLFSFALVAAGLAAPRISGTRHFRKALETLNKMESPDYILINNNEISGNGKEYIEKDESKCRELKALVSDALSDAEYLCVKQNFLRGWCLIIRFAFDGKTCEFLLNSNTVEVTYNASSVVYKLPDTSLYNSIMALVR